MALPPPTNPNPYNNPYGSPGGPVHGGPGTMPPAEERNWAMGCHLAALSGFIGIPAGNIIGPLIVWLIKKDQSAYINDQGKESVNFHISLWIYTLLSGLLWFTIVLIPLAFLLWGIIYIAGIVYTILGAVAASNGQSYRYPLTLRLIS